MANLLRIAKEDLEGARQLGSTANRNAIYLCSQAAEKVILALLTTEGIHGGVRHHLKNMVDLIPDENPLKPDVRAIVHLEAHATTYRYPTAEGRMNMPPARSDIALCADAVERALTKAAASLGVDLSAPNTPAARVSPIR